MPSEQRLHPATLLFDIAGHLKRLALPGLVVLFGFSRSSSGPGGSFSRVPEGWEAWLLVLFVPAMLFSIARYLSFRLRYDEHELVIKTGLVFRKQRHIPFSRIQNVDAVQNAIHRLLHLVEVRIETGGGKEEEARLSVLPLAALDELRARVFKRIDHGPVDDAAAGHRVENPVLVQLPPRELILLGLLDNKGMVLIGAAFGALWETGFVNRLMGQFFGGGATARSFVRDFFQPFVDGGPFPFRRLGIFVIGFSVFLLLVRVVSMIWALTRLYDFRLTRIGEDLRTEYGLFTKVTATVPIRRVQAITISAGPLHRWLKRTTVRVATAGGPGRSGGNKQSDNVREWLAPLLHQDALPQLLQHIVPGFDLGAIAWQPVHPRAFARAVKPAMLITAMVTLLAAIFLGWGAVAVPIVMLPWSVISTRQRVAHLGWAEGGEVVMMKSGWLWQQITLARVNKIQAVAMHQTPFDRRAAMARVRVDTAGAGMVSHRVDIPYLDHDLARALMQRLSAAAANTTFRW
jgi:putative membrane protein